MKRFLIASCALFLVVASAEAKLTRLAHFRAESLSAIRASSSALSMAAEQPMLGMMAMGGLQQAALELFGSVDQNKPVYAVVYYKGELPDLSTMDIERDGSEMVELATNVVIAVMMPIVDTPEAFLKSKGAVDVADGVFREDDTTWWAVKDGYAFLAMNAEAMGESVQELKRGISVSMPNMVAEVVVEKSALGVYSDVIQSVVNRTDTSPDVWSMMPGFSAIGRDFDEMLTEHQATQAKALARFMGQIDRLAMGMNYDLLGGFFCEWFAAFAEGSEVAKMLSSMAPLSDDLFSTIPVVSPFFVATGNFSDLTGETKQFFMNVRETWIPKIEDESIRKNIMDVLDEGVWMSENLERAVAFSDWDEAGRMVFVSNSRTQDNARYVDGSRKAMVSMMHVLKKVAPDQKLITFDPEALRGTVSFENLLRKVVAQFGEAPDAEDMEEMLGVVDAIIGRTFEFSSAVHGDYVSEVGKATGSTYSVPGASCSSAVTDRIQALLPEVSAVRPLQVGFISLGAMMRHLTPRVMKAVGEEDARVIAALDHLSTVDGGGTMFVSWKENTRFRQVMNLSAAEFKGLVKFFGAVSASPSVESDWAGDAEDDAAEAFVESEANAEEAIVVE